MTIKKRVIQLVEKHDTSNPFEIAKCLGIEVVYEFLGDSLGYFSRFNRTTIIHINESLSYEEQLSTCAHELGHAILHPEVNTAFLKAKTHYPTSRIEKEANLFMIELLSHEERGQPITIHEAVATYRIPKQLLIKNFYTNKEQMFQ